MQIIISILSVITALTAMYIVQYNKYSKMIGNMLIATRKGSKDEFLTAIYSSELNIALLREMELSLAEYMMNELNNTNDTRYTEYWKPNFDFNSCYDDIKSKIPEFSEFFIRSIQHLIPILLLIVTIIIVGNIR